MSSSSHLFAFSCRLAFVVLCLWLCAVTVHARPQDAELPEAYQYQYEVKDPEKQLFFNKNEEGDAQGKIIGEYSVWLPDGRLQKVSYIVDGNGFVPKVTYDTTNPLR